MGRSQFGNKFASQLGGKRSAKKTHMCMAGDCRHMQEATWGDEPCPNCKRVGTRQYFMSSAEQRRAAELLLMLNLGQITNLRCQPRYELHVEGEKICTYVGDFEYRIDGKVIVEDVKPLKYIDDGAKLKIALFNALHRKLGMTVTIHKKG
jgi:hypothetical protein